tara:strand:- start:1242 stop:1379 length:138 start_codon:yes stop_codon:yes gene_type:complete
MSKLVKNGDTDEFEDFGYIIKNKERINRHKLPKIKKDRKTNEDSI